MCFQTRDAWYGYGLGARACLIYNLITWLLFLHTPKKNAQCIHKGWSDLILHKTCNYVTLPTPCVLWTWWRKPKSMKNISFWHWLCSCDKLHKPIPDCRNFLEIFVFVQLVKWFGRLTETDVASPRSQSSGICYWFAPVVHITHILLIWRQIFKGKFCQNTTGLIVNYKCGDMFRLIESSSGQF